MAAFASSACFCLLRRRILTRAGMAMLRGKGREGQRAACNIAAQQARVYWRGVGVLKAAGEAKAVDRTRVGELARAADAPKEPLARRSGTEALGAWGALACIGLQGRRRSGAGSEGNLAGAGASGATKGFGGRRTGAVVGGLLTETAVKRMSCSRSSSFVPQWTSPSPGRSTWCPLLLRWNARMAVSVCCCCARAWLRRRSRCGGAHFWVVFASQDAKLAGSLRFVGRKMQFHQIRLFGWQFGWQFGFS